MSNKKKNTTNEKVVVIASQPQGSRNNKAKRKKARKQKRNAIEPTVRHIAPMSIGRRVRNAESFRNLRFQKREYLGAVPGSIATTVAPAIVLNPGSFPWCRKIASCFESYIFHSLRIEYVPRCATTKSGFAALCPDFNPNEPAPTDELEAFQNQSTVSDSAWAEMSQSYSPTQLKKRKSYFCRRNGSIVSGGDRDFYDTGNLYVITGGQDGTSTIGQLFVTYDVEFFTPEGFSEDTILGGSDTGLTLNTPLGNPSSTKDPSKIVEIITDPVSGQNMIKFLKDFHGLLNVKNVGTSLTTSGGQAYTMTGVAGPDGSLPGINGTEPFGGSSAWNGNYNHLNGASGSATAANLVSLVSSKAGQAILLKLAGATGTVTDSDFSFTKCDL